MGLAQDNIFCPLSFMSLTGWYMFMVTDKYFLKLCVLTRIFNLSYSDAGISAVAFRPGKSMAVSSSFGGNFKVCMFVSF